MRFQTLGRTAAIATLTVGLGLVSANVAQAHGHGGSSETMSEESASNTIVDVAVSNGSFNTLVQAVQAAGLVETLSSEGPFTVFAPTDAAFEELPDGALELLLKPENKDLLVKILTYHVVAGSVMSTDLSTGGVDTLGGGIAVLVTDDRVIINNGSVVTADVPASNGVIHVINRVLIPEAVKEELGLS